MPPASLSAKPLTRPGPRTARTAMSRTRHAGIRGSGRGTRGRMARGVTLRVPGRRCCVTPRLPAEDAWKPLLPRRGDDGVERVVDRHDPDEPTVVVDHRNGQQVVVGDDL